jgi:hypothetical protein
LRLPFFIYSSKLPTQNCGPAPTPRARHAGVPHRRARIVVNNANLGLKKLSLDLQGEYYVLRSVAILANLCNVNNATEDFEVAGPSTPPCAVSQPAGDKEDIKSFLELL